MVTVAVLTAVAVELAYSSRVSLQIAANARDELRASYAARGGVNLARLVLSFQQQLDGAAGLGGGAPNLASLASAAGGANAAGLAGALAGLAGGMPRVQLWNHVPVTSELGEGLFPTATQATAATPAIPATAATAATPATPATAAGRGGAGAVTFDARVEDEGTKVNAQLDGFVQGADRKVLQRTQTLYQLFCDAKWDPLFDREDAKGNKVTREGLLVNLRDWVDDNERTSELNRGGSPANCGLVVGAPPFVDAFGDENQPYDKGEARYRAKNAHMDSLDELYLVAGIGDAFMAAFRDNLTVYLPFNAKQNVNVTDRQRLLDNARAIADQPLNPMFLDPTFADRLQKAVMERTLGGILSITPKDFQTLVELAGVKTNPAAVGGSGTSTGNDALTDRSDTFRIRAKGTAGAVTTGIDAVVRMESVQQTMGQPMAAPGRLVHWREE